jgi:photosystem II stability/assembly factor-like uncharacterized protein
MKPGHRIVALGITALLGVACGGQTPPVTTPSPIPTQAIPATPGPTLSDIQKVTSQAATELAPTMTAVVATNRAADATRAAWTSTPVTPTAVRSLTPTLSPPTPTPENAVPFSSIHLFDTMQGWARGTIGHYPDPTVDYVWHTYDGGLTWQDVTPAGDDVVLRSALNGQVAWVSACIPPGEDCKTRLLRTLDGGATWEDMSAPYVYGDERTHFFSEQDGYLLSSGVAAGSAFLTFRETHDGGATWKDVEIASDYRGRDYEEPWGYHLCNACGDTLYFDFDRVAVVGGGDPVEIIPVWLSTDRGATWHRTDLDNPTSVDVHSWEEPVSLIFFPDGSALLPVRLTDWNNKLQAVAFFASSDGGFSWSYRSMVELGYDEGYHTPIVAPTANDIFMGCGEALCVSHDGARSWQEITSELIFYAFAAEPRLARSFTFVDAERGWALAGDKPYALWRTQDGGQTWTKLDPILLP